MNNDIKLINEILSATKEIVEGVDKGEISDSFGMVSLLGLSTNCMALILEKMNDIEQKL